MGSDGVYDVFVSYARSDEAAAAELNGWLRAQGLRTFFDRRELRPGLPWVPALEDAIGRSDAVAILVGKHGIGNTQQYERELALVRRTRDVAFQVFPVLMPGCDSPPTGFLQLLTWVDFSKGTSILQQPNSLATLRGALRGEAIESSSVQALICPYRGLEPFREEDAPLFCGRDDAIRELIAQVQEHAVVAVVGASGSGKSSLVFAGLLPALRQERDTRTWDVISFRPGASPLRALAAAFGSSPDIVGPAEIDAYLEHEAAAYRDGDANKLTRIVSDRLDSAPKRPDRLLIYVDQWEELYAMAPAAEDKPRLRQHSGDVEKFIALLVASASGARSRASVVLTVRADFYNSLIRNPLISALLPQQQVNVPPMGSSDLRSAIETPAKKAGLSFSPAKLVDQILNDVGSQEGRLPLLQFALKETWEKREGDHLTAEAYTAVGGVAGAIEKTAQDAYKRLTLAQQDAARRLFLRLVMPGEGREDTRARSVIPDDPQQRDVINLFSNPKTRLLVTGFAPLQGPAQAGSDVRATVEVAHEALIQRWATLQEWVAKNRENLRARAAILRAMAEWEEKGNIDDYLLPTGVQLERSRALLKEPGDVPVDDIRNYVGRSIEKEQRRLKAEQDAALADQKRIAEAERGAKEAAEKAASRAKASVRKLRLALAAFVTAAVAAAFFYFARYYGPVHSSQALAALESLAEAFKALEPTGRESAAVDALQDVAIHIGTVTNQQMLWTLAEALRALIARVPPNEALDAVLYQIGQTENPDALQALAEALRALGPKVTEERATEAPNQVLRQIGQTKNPDALRALAQALQALPTKLSEAQAQEALGPVLRQIGQTTDPYALRVLAQALQALPANLTEAQASQAFYPVLRQIRKNMDFGALWALAQALQALSANLTEAQAQEALDPVLRQIRQNTHPDALPALAGALQALAPKLTEAGVSQAFGPVMQQIGQRHDSDALLALAGALQALAPKLTEAQTQEVFDPVLLGINQRTDSDALRALAGAVEALVPKLTEAQAQEAFDSVSRQIRPTTNPYTLRALARALQALPAKLTEAQAQEALDSILGQIGPTTDPNTLRALAQALQALPAKLTEAQAQRALDAVLRGIGQTTYPDERSALAQALLALAAKLSVAQVQQALPVATSSMAYAPWEDEPANWAQALVALSSRLADQDATNELVAAIPHAYGPARVVLLEAIRARHPDALP